MAAHLNSAFMPGPVFYAQSREIDLLKHSPPPWDIEPPATFAGLWEKQGSFSTSLADVGYNNSNHHDLIRGLIRDLAALVARAA